MPTRFVFLPPANKRNKAWAEHIAAAVPQLDIRLCASREEALEALPQAQGAYGAMDAELLAAAPQLQWLACPAAGPSPSFYFPELVSSSVQVTNVRGVYNDHISAHIMAFVLAFSRSMHRLFPGQFRGEWISGGEDHPVVHLPEATALIVGVGGIGGATAEHCAHFGMHVIGIDPRVPTAPAGVAELHRPEGLDQHLSRADFVILTAPQTPATQGLFDREKLQKMKETGVLINIGRGVNVKLDDLADALYDGTIGGAALDVFEIEPLPADHRLWQAPNFLMTPHMAASGPYLEERRRDLLVENCRRLAAGEQLVNLVDKANWF